jgi:hypothetical protein
MNLAEIALVVSAIYCGGAYLFCAVQSWRYREGYKIKPELADQMERYTFHLGLCFILAVGFLGIIGKL